MLLSLQPPSASFKIPFLTPASGTHDMQFKPAQMAGPPQCGLELPSRDPETSFHSQIFAPAAGLAGTATSRPRGRRQERARSAPPSPRPSGETDRCPEPPPPAPCVEVRNARTAKRAPGNHSSTSPNQKGRADCINCQVLHYGSLLPLDQFPPGDTWR